jgi:glycosyltransferase involved in cell wall biosynthesis
MRVLLVHTIGRLGGAERSLLELTAALRDQGVHVSAVVPNGWLREHLVAMEVPTVSCPEVRPRRLTRGLGGLTALARLVPAAAAVTRFEHAIKPDIVHANNPAGLAAAILARGKTPLVWHVRDLRLPPRAAWLAQRCAAVLAVSPAVEQTLAQSLPEKLRSRLTLVRNGIAIPPHQPERAASARVSSRKTLNLPPNSVVVGMIANVVPWKRHDFLLETMAILAARRPSSALVVVGSDLFDEHPAYRRRLADVCETEPLRGRVRWMEELDDPSRLLPALDVLAHPAIEEPFGRVLCEAMAFGVPVVASRSAGPADIVKDGVSGILMDPAATPAAWADALDALLGDPARRRAMAEAGHVRVRQAFDVRRTAREVSDVYARCAVRWTR